MLHKVLQALSVCVYILWRLYGFLFQDYIQNITGRGYKNSVYTILDPMACWTGMRIVRFILLAYQVLRDLPVCVYSLWSLYGVVCQGAV